MNPFSSIRDYEKFEVKKQIWFWNESGEEA
jgi:hypothetical protein